MNPQKIFLLLAALFSVALAYAQNGGSYKSNRKAIKQAYMDEVRAIADKRNISPQEKRKQRDAAIHKFKADKRSNRLAFRRNTDHNRSAFEKKSKGYVPSLHKH